MRSLRSVADKAISLIIAATFGGWAQTAEAQSTLPVFSCGGEIYQVQSGQLRIFSPITSSYINVGSNQGSYNATGFNTSDGYAYGSQRTNVIRIGANGDTEIAFTGIPFSYSGDIDGNNNYWMRSGNNSFRRLNLVTGALVNISFTGVGGGSPPGGSAADVAYLQSGGDELLIGFNGLNMYRYNITDGTKELISVGSPFKNNGGYGATWTDVNGRLFTFNNSSGGIFEVFDYTTSSPSAVFVAQADRSGNNDGFSCPANAFPNLPPLAYDDDYTTPVDVPVVDNFITNTDIDVDNDPDGGVLTANIVPITDPTNGAVTISANGDFTYTPNAFFIGTDTFVYEVIDDTGLTAQATVTITIEGDIDFDLTKAQTPVVSSVTTAGQILTYEVEISNAGDIPLTDVEAVDTAPDGTVVTLSNPVEAGAATNVAGRLDVGETWTYTYTYEVTQDDIDSGAPLDNAVVATSDETGTDEKAGDTSTPIVQSIDYSLVKTVDTSELIAPGLLTYEIIVTNDGNVTLTDAALTDTFVQDAATLTFTSGPTLTGDIDGDGDLDVSEVWTYAATFDATQAFIDDGNDINNTADFTTVEGGDKTANAVTTIDQTPLMTVLKVEDTGNLSAPGTITYTVTVSNDGNVTLTNINLVDALAQDTTSLTLTSGPSLSGDLNDDLNIDVGETWVYTATFNATQDQIDDGRTIINTATIETAELPDQDSSAQTTITQTPSFTFEKSVDQLVMTAPGVLRYEIAVVNTGNVSMTNIVFTDTITQDGTALTPNPVTPTLTGDADGDGNLDVGESWLYVVTLDVEQTHIDDGNPILNAASFDPAELPLKSDDTTTTIAQTDALVLSKSVATGEPTSFSAVGDQIDFTFVVENTGNTARPGPITINDNQIAGPLECFASDLAPMTQASCTFTWTVEQEDMNAGFVTNTATAEDDDGFLSGPKTATVTAIQRPEITILKELSGTPPDFVPGNVINYDFTVVNTGDVTLTGPITVTDALITAISCNPVPAAGIAPSTESRAAVLGGTATTDATNAFSCTGSYTITQADLAVGSIVNVANVAATFDGDPVEHKGNAIYPVSAAPKLELDKSTNPRPAVLVANGSITYTYDVTNRAPAGGAGVAISEPIFIDDDKFSGPQLCFDPAPGFVGIDETVSCSFIYTVTQADLDAESVTNTAIATSSYTAGDGSTATVVSEPDSVTVTGDITPAMTLNKIVDSGTATGTVVGDTIAYTIVATNAGDQTISNVAITDPQLGALACTPNTAPVTLAPTETLTCTGSYSVTQDDIDNQTVGDTATAVFVNTATVAANDPFGVPLTPVTDGASHPIDPALPELTILKELIPDPNADPAFEDVGDRLRYRMTATNSGNTTINGVEVTDSLVGGICAIGTMLPDAVNTTCIFEYTVMQGDIDTGSVTNTGSVTGLPDNPGASTVGATSIEIAPGPNKAPDLTVTKNGVLDLGADGVASVGDLVTYTITVENTGNVTITETSVVDPVAAPLMYTLADDPEQNGTINTLAPGGIAIVTGTYALDQGDIDAGTVTNTAVASGTDPDSNTVDDTSDSTDPNDGAGSDDPTLTNIPRAPDISVTKVASNDTQAVVGETITYTYVVTNTGNVTLTDVTLADQHTSESGTAALALTPDSGVAASLLPGAFAQFAATYIVTQGDIDAGADVTNTVNVSSTSPAGTTPPTATATEAVDLEARAPELTVNKVIGAASALNPDGTFTQAFTVTLENTGNTTVTNPTLIDNVEVAFADAFTTGGVTVAPVVAYTAAAGTTGGVAPVANAGFDGDAADGVLDGASGTLNPGDVVTVTFTVLLDATQMIDGTGAAVETDNVVAASGMPPTGSILSVVGEDADGGPTTDGTAGAGVTPATDTGDIGLVKTAVLNDDDGTAGVSAGDTIDYTYSATNLSTVLNALNVTVSEDAGSFSGAGSLPTPLSANDGTTIDAMGALNDLAPGATLTWTATYTLVQADIDAGLVDNQAAAAARDPFGNDLTDLSDDAATDEDDPTSVTLSQAPELTVGKATGAVSGLNGDGTFSQSFAITLANTGNTTVTNPTLVDDLETLFADAFTPSAVVDTTGGVTVAPVVVYTAAVGITGGVAPVANVGFDGDADDGVLDGASGTLNPGDVVTVTFTVLLDATELVNGAGAAVETDNVVTASGMPPAGAILSVVGEDADGGPTTDGTAGAGVTPATDIGAIAVKKAAALITTVVGGAEVNVGDQIIYTYTVTNTDPVLNALNVVVTESATTFTGAGGLLAPVFASGGTDLDGGGTTNDLAPGAELTWTATYTLVQADIDAGLVDNQAGVIAEDPFGNALDDVSDNAAGADGTDGADNSLGSDGSGNVTSVLLAAEPELAMVKTLAAPIPTVFTDAPPNNVLSYELKVTNTGNITIPSTDTLTISDNIIAAGDLSCPAIPAAGLLPLDPDGDGVADTIVDGVNQLTCTGTYTITSDDISLGSVTNIALANTATTGDSPVDDAIFPVNAEPAVKVGKAAISVEDASQVPSVARPGMAFEAVGDVITYQFVITNSGGAAFSEPITLTDNKELTLLTVVNGGDTVGRVVPAGDPFTCWAPLAGSDETLTPDPSWMDSVTGPFAGETAICEATYTVTQADLDAGQVDNIVLAKTEFPAAGGTPVSSIPAAESVPAGRSPDIELVKTAVLGTLEPDGTFEVTYTLVSTNTGNVTLDTLTLVDDLEAQFGAGVITAVVSQPTVTVQPTLAGSINVPDTPTTYTGGATALIGSTGVLAVGDSFTVAFTVKMDAAASTSLTNTATVGATPPSTLVDPTPSAISDNSENGVETDDGDATTGSVMDGTDVSAGGDTDIPTVVIPPLAAGDIGLVKTAVLNDDDGFSGATAGDTIDYTYTVTNLSTVLNALNVTVTEDAGSFSGAGSPPTPLSANDGTTIDATGTLNDLAPGATLTWTAAYTLLQADIDAGMVDNQAAVSASDPFGNILADVSDDAATDEDDPTSVALVQAPQMVVDKVSGTASGLSPDGTFTQAFTVTLENTGNTSIINPTLIDNVEVAFTDAFTPSAAVDTTGGVTVAPVVVYTAAAGTSGGVAPVANADFDGDAVDNVLDGSGGTLNPGDVVTVTFTVLLDATQMGGQRVNLVTASGTQPAGSLLGVVGSDENDDPADDIGASFVAQPLAVGDIGLVKTAVLNDDDGTAGVSAGDTVDYTYTVTNLNTVLNALNVTVSEPNNATNDFSGVGAAPSPANEVAGTGSSADSTDATPDASWDVLAPGDTVIFTATYVLEQGDIDAGVLDNSAVVGAKDPFGNDLDDVSDDGTDGNGSTAPGEEDITRVFLSRTPSLVLTKSADASAVQDPAVVGDVISYTFELVNTGNVALSGTTPVDTLTDADGQPLTLTEQPSVFSESVTEDGILQVGETIVYKASFDLNNQALNAGGVANTAVSTGTPIDENGDPIIGLVAVFDTSDDPADMTDTVPTGETGAGDPTLTSFTQNAEIQLTKTVSEILDVNGNGFTDEDDIVAWTFRVENVGNVDLTGITISDSIAMVVGDPIDLAIGAFDETTFTVNYAIDSDDLINGGVENTATASGTAPASLGLTEPVTDISDSGAGSETTDEADLGEPGDLNGTVADDNDPTNDPTVVLFDPFPLVGLTKSISAVVDENANGEIDAGDRVTYAFALRNLGNVALVVTTIDDPIVTVAGGPVTIGVGEADDTTFTASYMLDDDDVAAGAVENTAVVTTQAVDANGVDIAAANGTPLTVSDTSDSGTDPQLDSTGSPIDLGDATLTEALETPDAAGVLDNDPTNDPTVLFIPKPALSLIKSVGAALDSNSDGQFGGANDIIQYVFTVRNVGNTDLTDVTITDALMGLDGDPIDLAIGAGDSVTFTGEYLVTEADITRGYVENTAKATGNAALNGTPVYGPTGAVVMAEDISDSGTDPAGQDAPNSETTETPNGEGVTDGDATNDPTVLDVPAVALPQIDLIKSITDVADTNGSGVTDAGDTLTYSFVVTNTGNADLVDITITDPRVGTIAGSIDLEVGQQDTDTFTATAMITDAEAAAGVIVNTASVEGSAVNSSGDPLNDPGTDTQLTAVDTSDSGNEPKADQASTPDLIADPAAIETIDGAGATNGDLTDDPTVLFIQNPGLSLIKSVSVVLDTTGDGIFGGEGDEILYTFTVANTGNTALAGLMIDDPIVDVVGGPIDLAAGAIDLTTFTATKIVTLADFDVGFVENTAVVSGVAVDPNGVAFTDATGADLSVSDRSDTGSDRQAGTIFNPEAQETPSFNGTLDGDPTNDPTIVNVPSLASPSLSVIKSVAAVVDTNGDQVTGNADDSVTYSFVVTNDGNTDLADVVLNDPLLGGEIGTIDALAIGASQTFTADYILTADDVVRTYVENSAAATGLAVNSLGNPILDLGTGDQLVADDVSDAGSDPAIAPIANPEGVESSDAEGGTDADPTNDPTVLTVPLIPSDASVSGLVFLDIDEDNAFTEGVDERLSGYAIELVNAQTGQVIVSGVTGADGSYSLEGFPVVADATLNFIDPETGEVISTIENLNFVLSANITNQDLPLIDDSVIAAEDAVLTLTKSASVTTVIIGQSVPYTITVSNESDRDAAPVTITDTLPNGMIFIEGTAAIDGTPVTPAVSGRVQTFANLTIPADSALEITLNARVLGSAPVGELINAANALDGVTGARVTPTARAIVVRRPEAVFDCSDVIGKVFDDRNMDGYQDMTADERAAITNQDLFGDKLGGKLAAPVIVDSQSEPGIAGVRLVTPTGTVITTDEYGRYSVPCAELPANIGTNFTLKLDIRSLPTGYRVTTENPRTLRLTRGIMTEMNFGAAIGRVVDVDLSTAAFVPGQITPVDALKNGLPGLLRQVAGSPSVIRMTYYHNGEDQSMMNARLDAVEALINDQWRAIGNYRLIIERTVARLQ